MSALPEIARCSVCGRKLPVAALTECAECREYICDECEREGMCPDCAEKWEDEWRGD